MGGDFSFRDRVRECKMSKFNYSRRFLEYGDSASHESVVTLNFNLKSTESASGPDRP